MTQEIIEQTTLCVGDSLYRNEWRHRGLLHRSDGPAVEFANGNKEWWINGLLHRIEGPAIEHSGGKKEWWVNGKLHRTDGPAIEHPDGAVQYWENGEFLYFAPSLNEEDQNDFIEINSSPNTDWLQEGF